MPRVHLYRLAIYSIYIYCLLLSIQVLSMFLDGLYASYGWS